MDSKLPSNTEEIVEVQNQTESVINSTVSALNNMSLNSSTALNITEATLDTIIDSHEVVFIIFYVEWCRFSKLVLPTFNEFVAKINSEFQEAGRLSIGMINCDTEETLRDRFNISCYPQFKLIRNGMVSKRNYEGNRTVESLVEYIKKELADPIKEFTDGSNLGDLDPEKRLYIGYFHSKETPEYDIFRQIASNFKHYCQFRATFGESVPKNYESVQPLILLRPDITLTDQDETFSGGLFSYDTLNAWMAGNYLPLVRKTSLTSLNSRDYYQEYLPMLILYHRPNDNESVKRFTKFCESTLMYMKNKLLIVTTSDQHKIRRLTMYSKDESHLPLIAYETTDFHFFLFGNMEDMVVPGKLEQFVNDLVHNTPRDTGEAPYLTNKTINSIIAANEVVFLMFCIKNHIQHAFVEIPTFNEVALNIKVNYPQEGKIYLGKVDISEEKELSRRFDVFYHPTFVLIRDGQHMKKSFKGKRTIEKLAEFIEKELENPLVEFTDPGNFGTLDPRKRLFIGYFDSKDVPEYDILRRVASVYKDHCQFRVGFGESVVKMHPQGQPKLVLQTDVTTTSEETFNGSLCNYVEVDNWISENYVPLVRQISLTSDNQHNYYDEKLPMLVLVHKTGDNELVERYTKFCEANLSYFKQKLLFLTSVDEGLFSSLYTVFTPTKATIPYIALLSQNGYHFVAFSNIQEMEDHGKLESFINNNIDNLDFGLFS